jgi:uncharacterized protein (DUF1330 family)
MNVTNDLYPTPDQLTALIADAASGPIAMVNLVKFREKAVYRDGRQEDLSGRDAYLRYVARMRPIVEAAGGRLLFSGNVNALVVGEVGELWDAVGIVEYPSRAEFVRIATCDEVQTIGVDREAGLAGQLLIVTTAEDLTSR